MNFPASSEVLQVVEIAPALCLLVWSELKQSYTNFLASTNTTELFKRARAWFSYPKQFAKDIKAHGLGSPFKSFGRVLNHDKTKKLSIAAYP